MSEEGWGGDLSGTKRKKKSIPGWVWGCGIGCGLFLILAVVGVYIAFRLIGEAVDQDAQWEKIAQVLPHDEPPEDLFVFGVPFRLDGVQFWSLTDRSNDDQAFLFHAEAGSEASQTRDELLDPEKEESIGGPMGDFGRHDVQAGSVNVQGRELDCVRYTALPKDETAESALEIAVDGATIVVDLAPEGSGELLILMLTRQGADARVEDDEVREFLEPFRIPGGDRAAPAEIGEGEETEDSEELEPAQDDAAGESEEEDQ